MEKLGQPDATIVRLGKPEDREFRISLRGSQETDRDLSVRILKGLNEALGTEVVAKSVESVGPRVGGELRQAGVTAIVLSWIGILLYVWFRFEWQYAPGAVLALVHDVLFTAGLFSLFGWEFDMNVLAALLVIIGYSMNDTIVIFDRIRETIANRGTAELESVVNEALNSTLSRTILTSGLTQLVVVAILLVGGPVLRGFALALFIGILVGTYSSIYIASAALIWLARRYGHPVPGQAGRPRARRSGRPRGPESALRLSGSRDGSRSGRRSRAPSARSTQMTHSRPRLLDPELVDAVGVEGLVRRTAAVDDHRHSGDAARRRPRGPRRCRRGDASSGARERSAAARRSVPGTSSRAPSRAGPSSPCTRNPPGSQRALSQSFVSRLFAKRAISCETRNASSSSVTRSERSR